MAEEKAYDSLQLSASALQLWYELDPAGARPAIIAEISRPRPLLGARVLGILPDHPSLRKHANESGYQHLGVATVTAETP